MSSRAVRGFTIIEVMLFLAVSGMFTVGVLVGSGAAISKQRYRDSVNTLKGFIQDQYSQTMNVVSSEAENPVCNRSNNSLNLDEGSPKPRGTSDCLRLGRYVLVEPTQLTAHDVVGLEKSPTITGTDDVSAIQNYDLRLTDTYETREVAWGANIVAPKTNRGQTASILIIRSPLSGTVLTFVKEGNQTPSNMVQNNNMKLLDLCVDSQAGAVTSKRLAVRINRLAANQSAVEIPLESSSVCD